MSDTVELPILHFNDVYRVTQKYTPPDDTPAGDEQRYISAAQFARMLSDVRDGWQDSSKAEGQKEGLVLFSGDVFAPSVESTITRGSHMVPLLNTFNIDCSVTGNHDFDHSFAHLTKLIDDCKFPWLLSNIINTQTNAVPAPLQEYLILDRCGLKIGLVGLVEPDWIATIPSFPPHFAHQPMAARARELSRKLRGEMGCDLIIALTHSRVGNDIALAKEVGAVKYKEGGEDRGDGVDLLLGGHDHIYYLGKGVDEWEGWERPESIPGTEEDEDTLIVKSGTDFRDLSSFTLSLERNPSSSSPRKYLIHSITGQHLTTTPDTPTSEDVQALIDELLKGIGKTLDEPACFTVAEWDCRSEIIRTQESAFGNWLADVLLHSYSDALEAQGVRTDLVMNCGGTLRGDSTYGPGIVTLGDILEILPFEDPVVVVQLDGKAVWDCLEGALSKYPAQEGRFPIVGGMKVEWDSRRPPGQRVLSVQLVSHHKRSRSRSSPFTQPLSSSSSEDEETDEEEEEDVKVITKADGVEVKVRLGKKGAREPIERKEGGRLYTVVTREYMAQGYDGYDAMKSAKVLIDDENAQIMSNILRHFLLGASFLTRKRRLVALHAEGEEPYRSPTTEKALIDWDGLKAGEEGGGEGRRVVKQGWKSVRNALRVARMEHMSEVDVCGGQAMRRNVVPHHQPPPPSFSLPPTTTPTPTTATSSPVDPKRTPTSTADRGQAPSSEVSAPCSPDQTLAFFVKDRTRKVFHAMDDDVAVVAPFIDGRMRDVARE